MKSLQLRRRQALGLATTLAALALTLTACGGSGSGSSSAGGDTIKIGTDLPLTGVVAAQAEQLLDGYKLGIKAVNDAGGINGKKLDLVVTDDKFQPNTAISVVTKMITQDKVQAILGTFGSDPGLAASTVAEQYKVPIVHTFVSDPQITSKGFKYTFNLFNLAAEEEAVIDDYVTTQTNYKTVAIVHVTDGWAASGADTSKAFLGSKGVTVTDNIAVPKGQSDYTAALSQLRAHNPDVVKLIGYDSDVATMIKEIKQLNIKPKVLYVEGDPLVNPAVTGALGTQELGVSGSASWFMGIHAFPEANKLATDYQTSTKKEASTEVIKGYQGVQVLAAALRNAKSPTSAAIRDALAAVKVDTVLGSVSFQPNGQATSPVTLAQYQTGMKLLTIWPQQYQQAKLVPLG